MKIIYLTLALLCSVIMAKGQNKCPAPVSSAEILFEQLRSVKGKGILFGHQDALAYGIGWKHPYGQSDVKRTAGDYPALFGWELGGIELGNKANLDGVPFDKIREFAIWVHENGGINTFSWHAFSPIDETKNSWDTQQEVVQHIIPGGLYHENLKNYLDKIASFFLSLKTEEGELVPFIFRPWHEMDGGWFWWGSTHTSPDEYKKLFRFTIEYLHSKGVTNFLTAYSPDRNFTSEEEYLTWYPGNDIVDIVGIDNYWDLREPGKLDDAVKKLEIVANFAIRTGNIAAFTETGDDTIINHQWFTQKLGTVLNASDLSRQIAYVMVWRNHDLNHFYVPYPEHPAAGDFRKFTGQEHIWLLQEWRSFLKKTD